jgi:predicted MFS family arabinose efflux permease
LRTPDGKSFKRSFLAAMARTIGVALGAGAGSFIYKLLGPQAALAWPLAVFMFIGSFVLIWFLEYEREQMK